MLLTVTALQKCQDAQTVALCFYKMGTKIV